MKIANGAALAAKGIFRLIEDDLAQVESQLQRQSDSSLELVNDISRYIHSSGGKRVRPALLLLASKLSGYSGPPAVRLGMVVELIHVATLVHDDIIDNAGLRRGRPSVNARWGNAITVLAGDWLYMTAFQIALELRNFRVLDILIDVTRKMVEGELMQLETNGDVDISAQAQLDICLHKTAFLFAGCAQLGGVLADIDSKLEQSLYCYGRSLGMAFQLVDDVLDFTADQSKLGKPVLKDLEEGRITLPLTYLLNQAKPVEVEFVRSAVRDKQLTPENKREIIRLVRQYGTDAAVKQLAEDYAEQARRCLDEFPASVYRDALRRIPDFITSRDH